MNTRIILLTCTFITVACGNSNNRPAQNASTDTSAEVHQRDTTPALPLNSTKTSQATETKSTDSAKTTGTFSQVAASPITPEDSTTRNVSDEPKSVDNTKTNARDREDALTPMDQGNSATETKITANIRKGIVGDKSVSFSGKNVKIITIGTKVTLRGPVKNDAERATIESIAKRTAGVSNVDNQLEVSH